MNEIQFIVSPAWLASQLNHPQLVIIDCRFQLGDANWGYQQYLTSHIEGAYYLDLAKDLSAPVAQHGGRHPLPDEDLLAKKFAEMGINMGETLVVTYDSSRFAFAARLWWLLRYLGHDRVAILDGGWQGWCNDGYPVTESLPTPQQGNFIAQAYPDWIVEIETVKASQGMPSVILVDSRDSDRYRGEQEPIDPIAGHILGAINSPWQQVTDEAGYLCPLTVQKSLWTNCEQSKEIIVYCGSGVTACVNLLSLELSGIKTAKLYPGGWSDWCSYLV